MSCPRKQSSHGLAFSNVKVVGHEANFQERLFLEVWLSTKDQNAGNDHIAISEVYKSLACALILWLQSDSELPMSEM